MIDRDAALRAWLLDPAGPVVELLGTPDQSIFAAHLPEKYDPRQTGQGRAVVVSTAGTGLGSSQAGSADRELPIIYAVMRTMVWAGENESQRAHEVDRAITDWIDNKNNIDLGEFGFILSCTNLSLGQDWKDQATKFDTVFAKWNITFRKYLV